MSEAKSSQASEWQRFSPMPERSQTQFGLVSYNVLADVYAMSPISPDLYNHVSKEHLSWEYRRDALRKDILAIGPDVVCMQECDLNNWETDFAEYFAEHGFGSLLQNDASRHPDHSTGLAVLYRRTKFSLAWHQSRSRALLLALKPVPVKGGKLPIRFLFIGRDGCVLREALLLALKPVCVKVKGGKSSSFIFMRAGCMGVLYRRTKFSLAWHQSCSRALLLALKPVKVKGEKSSHSFIFREGWVCVVLA